MSILEVVVLAVVQGLTEFLPVSSSGHIVLRTGSGVLGAGGNVSLVIGSGTAAAAGRIVVSAGEATIVTGGAVSVSSGYGRATTSGSFSIRTQDAGVAGVSGSLAASTGDATAGR